MEKMLDRTYIHKYAKTAPSFKAFKDHLTSVMCDHAINPGVFYKSKNAMFLKNKKQNCVHVF